MEVMPVGRTWVDIMLFGIVLGALSAAVLAQTYSASFQNSIRVGYDSRTCVAGLEGAVRYVSSTGRLEVCVMTPSAQWKNLAE
jgi:hypothetical protein